MSELNRVQMWADALIAMHLDESWSFGFDNAKRRAGLCDFTKKRISVSRYLAARYDDDTNHQTLLHEVAHALAGPTAGHGSAWKAVAVQTVECPNPACDARVVPHRACAECGQYGARGERRQVL